MKKENWFWRIIISLNIAEIILFVFSRIFTIIVIHSAPFSYKIIDNIDTITGTYYYRINFELMIANLILLILSLLGIFFVLNKIKTGKIFLIFTTLIFLLNRTSDFLTSLHFIYWIILVALIYWLLGKNKLFQKRKN